MIFDLLLSKYIIPATSFSGVGLIGSVGFHLWGVQFVLF